ncbi:hypothetical protein L6R50_27865 [Myxococcota bacterium]|nr:hypothetical protein [Myxococcota bacterium]
MAGTCFRVDAHWVALGAALAPEGAAPDFAARAYIACAGSGYQLVLWFLDDGATMPSATFDDATQAGTLYLLFSTLSAYLDLLRHESPVYAWVTSDAPSLNCLRTTPEKVAGEQV